MIANGRPESGIAGVWMRAPMRIAGLRGMAVVAVMVVSAACSPGATPGTPGSAADAPRSGGTVTVGVGSAAQIETDRINTRTISFAVSMHIYETLYRQDDKTGAIGPGLVERTETSADGL